MSELHEFEADFLRRVVAARKEGRYMVRSSRWAEHQEMDSADKEMSNNLEKRDLVAIEYGHGQWNKVVVTDKGYEALAEHLANERMSPVTRILFGPPFSETTTALIAIVRDQAKRIAELELRA